MVSPQVVFTLTFEIDMSWGGGGADDIARGKNDGYTQLKPMHNIGKTKKQKCSQIYTQLAWYKDNDGRKLSSDVLSFSNN